MNLAHRDDLPMEVAEAFERMIKEQFPGMKVVFAGDAPEGVLPPEKRKELEEFMEYQDELFRSGRCQDCGKQIEPWPPEDLNATAESIQTEGWKLFYQGQYEGKRPAAWQCPECDQSEGEMQIKEVRFGD